MGFLFLIYKWSEVLKSCSAREVPLLKKAQYRPVWSLPMIQRRTGWKCCGQMRPKSSSLASTQLVVFGGGGMLPMTPRRPQTWRWKHYALGVFFCQGDRTTAPHQRDDGRGHQILFPPLYLIIRFNGKSTPLYNKLKDLHNRSKV